MAENSSTDVNVEKLYGAALNFIWTHKQKYKDLPIAARDKHFGYYKDIIQSDGIMKATTKDNGGHASNPINDRLDGLFFLAIEDEDRFSNFGKKRFHLPLAKFLMGYHQYFSDFYCMSRNAPHYVQIVLAKPGSEADDLCKELGLKLLEKTKFFGKTFRDGAVQVPSFMKEECIRGEWKEVEKIRYEFLLCEDIDIAAYMRQKRAQLKRGFVTCYGYSTAGGRPNYPGCEHCDVIKEINSNAEDILEQFFPEL